jgi:hypothetical protein
VVRRLLECGIFRFGKHPRRIELAAALVIAAPQLLVGLVRQEISHRVELKRLALVVHADAGHVGQIDQGTRFGKRIGIRLGAGAVGTILEVRDRLTGRFVEPAVDLPIVELQRGEHVLDGLPLPVVMALGVKEEVVP